MIQILKENRVYDDTLIILMSDHGESFYDNKILHHRENNNYFLPDGTYTGHSHSLHEAEINVPLIFHYKKFKGKKVIDSVIRTVDIFPTILDILNRGKGEDPLELLKD